jgi:hypothetical protein
MTVDRVIGEQEGDWYMVKWCGQPYDLSTWEDAAPIQDNSAIEGYRKLRQKSLAWQNRN